MGLLDLFRKKESTPAQVNAKTGDINSLGVKFMQVDKDTNEDLTPQMLMGLAYSIVENHPEINASYRDYTNFFIGKGLQSFDPITTKYLKEHPYLQSEVKKFVRNYLLTGNAYFQMFYEQTNTINEMQPYQKLKLVQTISDSSRIYYNLDSQTEEDYWLYSVHYTQNIGYTNFNVIGSDRKYTLKTAFYWVKYALAQMWQGYYEYCMPLHKKQLKHLKNEFSRNAYYGHSLLMSGYDYAKAMKEIQANAFRIAKYQALGTKIVSVGDPAIAPITNKEISDLENKFYYEGKQVLFTNKPVKVESITFEGEYNTLQELLEYNRKALTSGAAPSLFSPYADDFANRSIADDSMIGFFLNLESERNRVVLFLNEIMSELVYGDKKHNCKLYFNAPTANKEDGEMNIDHKASGDDSTSQEEPEEFYKEGLDFIIDKKLNKKTMTESIKKDNKVKREIMEKLLRI